MCVGIGTSGDREGELGKLSTLHLVHTFRGKVGSPTITLAWQKAPRRIGDTTTQDSEQVYTNPESALNVKLAHFGFSFCLFGLFVFFAFAFS